MVVVLVVALIVVLVDRVDGMVEEMVVGMF